MKLGALAVAGVFGISVLVAGCGDHAAVSSPVSTVVHSRTSTGRAVTTSTVPASAPRTAATSSTSSTPSTAPTSTAPPRTTTTSSAAYLILPPAAVPPRVPECTETLDFATDGTAGPLLCQNGDLNTVAWQYYAAEHLLVMTLGPYATPPEVLQAMCSDVANHGSIPTVTDGYSLAAKYYGWNFSAVGSLPSGLVNGGCG